MQPILVQHHHQKLNINQSDEQIIKMGKSKYKQLVNGQENSKAFHELTSSTKSKVKGIIKSPRQDGYKKLQVQEYLLTDKLTTLEKQTDVEMLM